MSAHRLEPASSIIRKIGIDNVVAVTGKHVSRVYRWMYPKEKGGTGGVIPYDDARGLLAYAQTNNIDLTPGDFFAAPEAERAA
jgi:hypothetical protein